jgi:hypothetical protein
LAEDGIESVKAGVFAIPQLSNGYIRKNGNRLQIRRRDGNKFYWFLGTPPIARPTKSDLRRGNSDRQWSGLMGFERSTATLIKLF